MPTPTSYYTPCATIIAGCHLYIDANYQNAAPPGYYSDGVKVYEILDNLGTVENSISNCPNIGGGGGCSCCFVGNTMISLKDGSQKSIANIQPGEIVLTFNEFKNQIEENKILSKIGRITDDIIRYTFTNGVMIESTKDHPYYVNGLKIASLDPISTTDKYGFEIDVDMIKIGDVVNLEDGSTSVIEDIEILDTLQKVYTLSIENNHNFYANGILVHNKRPGTICCINGNTTVYVNCPCTCLGSGWLSC